MSSDDTREPDGDQSVWDELEAVSEKRQDAESADQLDGDPAEDTPEPDEIFDEMDVSQVDGEALWDELAGFESASEPLDAETGPTVDRELGEPAAGREPASQVEPDQHQSEFDGGDIVDKRNYCQQCPYFSEPPDVACSHEGTTIVEVLMDGQFRLRNCPVVTDSGPDRTILNDEH